LFNEPKSVRPQIDLNKKNISDPDVGGVFENLIIRNNKAIYNWNHLDSVGLWIGQATLPSFNNLEIKNNGYGIYWPNGNCDNLTGNCSGNAVHDTYCSCCPF